MQELKNYINGIHLAPTSGLYIDNYNPATGEVYSRLPDSDARDVQLAVDAAWFGIEASAKVSPMK